MPSFNSKMYRLILSIIALVVVSLVSSPVYSDGNKEIRFDFETGDLQGWRIVEGAFDKTICDLAFFHLYPDRAYNKQGEYFLNTHEKSDGNRTDTFTGIIESPVFSLKDAEISFLVGGGNNPSLYVTLCNLDGDEILTARGNNTEIMQRIFWDASELVEQKCFLRIVDNYKGGWGHITFDDFLASGVIDEAITKQRYAQREQIIKNRRTAQIKSELNNTLTSLELAIIDLNDAFASEYLNGQQYLSKLTTLKNKIDNLQFSEIKTIRDEVASLQRKALLDNPLVTNNPILFVSRPQYLSDHHSTATIFQNGEINTASFRGKSALKVLDIKNNSTTTILDCPDGIIRDPEINYDGDRIIVSVRNNKADDYHLYELDIETLDSRQLTFGSELSDIDPVYLPTGEIVFVSTREPKYCQCNRHIMGNLFKMEADGANIQQIGRNTLFEGHPVIMPDGRILYDRWEYVDKHFGPAFGLWTSNPDGTNHAIYYGNNAWSPGAILDARIIPETQNVVATLGSCHDRPWGAIAIIDRQIGLDGIEPIIHSWPSDINPLLSDSKNYGKGASRGHPAGGQIDNFTRLQTKYEDPFPLSDKYFLCSRTIEGERTGLFLLDVFGNEICIYQEEKSGCYDPMLIKNYPTPKTIPSRVDYSRNDGLFYVADVYIGDGMKQVARGTIKTLRIVEAPPKLFWTQPNWNLDATQAPAINFNCTNNKRILGDVPVEKDGSAYFSVPADKFIYFQLLDDKGMMVNSMRSGTTVRPGELLSCIGCHEQRLTSAQNNMQSLALRNPPADYKPWYGAPREFNYLTEVQPVFDTHCVSCHDYGKKAGKALNLSGDLGLSFNTSYLELRRKSSLRWFKQDATEKKLLVKSVDDGPPEALPAFAWGSHRSRLVDVILSGHGKINHDKESMDRIITWIDMNAPYYGSYASVYPDNVFGRSPLNDQDIKELRELTGVNVGDISTELQGSQCNFTRPEFSPCLQGLKKKNPSNYAKALQIIEKGKKQFAAKPRMDMPGAQMLQCDLDKIAKYQNQVNQENQTRKNLQSFLH